MAKVSKFRAAATGRYGARAERLYGTTHQSESDSEDFAVRSIDTLRSELEQEEFSCTDCCKATPGYLYNFTIESCINPCKKPKPAAEEEPPGSPTSTMDELDIEIMKMKAVLKFHFMNPFEKWKYASKRRFPWKFVLQLASIILVTAQIVLFANSKSVLMDFLRANKQAFAQLFVANPCGLDFSGSDLPVPIRVIYTNEDLFEQLNHSVTQYFHLDQVAVGSYGYQWSVGEGIEVPQVHLGIHKHVQGVVNPTTKTYNVSSQIKTYHYDLYNVSDPINNVANWSEIEGELPWVLRIYLNFTVSSIFTLNDEVKCFEFDVSFLFRNEQAERNIKMLVDMSVVQTQMSDCGNSSTVVDIDAGVIPSKRSTAVDCLVIVASILSIILCGRSLLRSLYLSKVVRRFFIEHFKWSLKPKHFSPLFNLWFLGLVVSNGLVLVASVMKFIIDYANPDSVELVDATSIILGLAVFGQWCGILRFLSYFDKYNILLITLKLSMPSVLRFGVCAGVLYISFVLLGWLVLGPYHPKFRDPSTTSECLFSLLNGDDMFATYEEMSHVSKPAWIFSKIYLYIFISLFIYVVLSVFISLISDTYETLHDHWGNRTRGLLKDFATDQLGRGRLRSGSHHSHHSMVEEDTEDYNLMRDFTVSCEHQPLNDMTPPKINIQDSSGHLQPHPLHNRYQMTTDPSKV